MLKGIPLAYNKDLQEDKEAIFDTTETVQACLRAASAVIDNLTVNESRPRRTVKDQYAGGWFGPGGGR